MVKMMNQKLPRLLPMALLRITSMMAATLRMARLHRKLNWFQKLRMKKGRKMTKINQKCLKMIF